MKYAVLILLFLPSVLISQQANVNLDYNPQKNKEGLIPFSAPLNSPNVDDNGMGTFSLKAPGAKEVHLPPGAIITALGKGNKPIPFSREEDGIWTLTIGPLSPDIYAYHFAVDGIQIADPSNTYAAFTAMPPNSQLIVHDRGPSYYDAKNVPHGNVVRHIYHSDVTGDERELYVYTPPGYDEERAYPVLYLLGGESDIAYQNGMDDYERINHVPVFVANMDVGHGGTYSQPHGGEFAKVATAWYKWQLKGDTEAGKMFTGKNPLLSASAHWKVNKKNIP